MSKKKSRATGNETGAKQGKATGKARDPRTVFLEYVRAIGSAVLIALLLRQFIFQAFTIPSGSMLDTLLIGDFLFVDKVVYGSKSPTRIKFFKLPLIDNVPYFKLPAVREPRQGDIIVFEFPEDRNTDYIKRCVAVAGDTLAVRHSVLYVNGKAYESNFADREGDHSCVPQFLDPDRCESPRTRREPGLDKRRFNQHYTLGTALLHFYQQNKTQPFLLLAEAALATAPDDSVHTELRRHLTFVVAGLEDGRTFRNKVLQAHAAGLIRHYEQTDQGLVVPEGYLWMMGDNRFNSEDSRVWGPLDVELIKGKAVILYWSWSQEKFRPRLSRVGDIIR